MLLRQMSFWIHLASTTSFPSQKRKFYMHYVCDRYNAFVSPSIGLRVLLLVYDKW